MTTSPNRQHPASPAFAASDDAADTDELRVKLARLEAALAELEARNRELEDEAVLRGVKLSCTRIALSRAKLAFDESTRHRQEMVQDIAHDLRTPLTSIKGAAQNLLDGVAGPLSPDAREYLEIVGEHADRLINAVNWMLEAMRSTVAPMELDFIRADLAGIVRDVVRSLLPIATDKGITLRVAGQSVEAMVDVARIRNVVENLVGNALKFTAAGGEVTVYTDSDGEGARLVVTDTGVGMNEQELGRIFERYYRRGVTVGSSGLGLVISREIIRLHGGEVCARSTLGEGSTFTVRLPKDGDTETRWMPDCS